MQQDKEGSYAPRVRKQHNPQVLQFYGLQDQKFSAGATGLQNLDKLPGFLYEKNYQIPGISLYFLYCPPGTEGIVRRI